MPTSRCIALLLPENGKKLDGLRGHTTLLWSDVPLRQAAWGGKLVVLDALLADSGFAPSSGGGLRGRIRLRFGR